MRGEAPMTDMTLGSWIGVGVMLLILCGLVVFSRWHEKCRADEATPTPLPRIDPTTGVVHGGIGTGRGSKDAA